MRAWWNKAARRVPDSRTQAAPAEPADAATPEQPDANSRRPKLETIPRDLLTLSDYAALARDYIDPPVWEWLEGGSGSLDALDANRAAFRRHAIYNRLLVDCRHGSTRTRLLGLELAHPIALAPIGFQAAVHAEGEIATAAGAIDTLMVVSTLTSQPIREIARAAAGPLWFQVYFQPERAQTLKLVRVAEAAGVRGIVVTIDTPVKPQGLSAQKAGFSMPAGVRAVHAQGFEPSSPIRLADNDSLVFQGIMSLAPRFDDLKWLREQTRLPLLAKGVGHPDDAKMLLAAGCDGLVVSNHGGRALEAAPATLDVLHAIRAAAGKDVPILFDGGVRSGADVFKALALGADAVMVGRPQMHALAVAGSLGVAHMLKLLREDLEVVMALAGCPTLADIGSSALLRR